MVQPLAIREARIDEMHEVLNPKLKPIIVLE